MKKKTRQIITVNAFNEETGKYTAFSFFPHENITFHKNEDNSLSLHAPGLRYGSVKILETKEDLLNQVKSINIIE